VRIWDNRKAAMNEQKEMPVVINSPAPRFRYWFTPPESLTIKVADIEPFVPRANWKVPAPAGLTVEIPAEKVLSKNVPRIPLRLLAELLPDHISSSDGVVKLPASKLAATYRLVEHVEELIPEPPPEPVLPPEPEIVPEPVQLPEPAPEPAAETEEKFGTLKTILPPASVKLTPATTIAPVTPPAIEEPAPVTDNDPAPISEPVISAAPAIEPPSPAVQDPIPVAPPQPAAADTHVASVKFPPRRTGSFVGLPLFRRKTPVAIPPPVQQPSPHVTPDLPPVEPPQDKVVPAFVLPEIPLPPPRQAPSPPAAVALHIPDPAPEPVPEPEPVAEIVSEPDFPPPVATPVRMLRTEHFPTESQNQEIVEQEPLQALFLTEETMTVNRVIELCGGLPGINSCVLAHGSIVVASHNVPESVDLVSMSAHASDMLKAMRDSSARMGVGTVPAVTLHTEKGVISFFNREDLTMLVFHKDRGFVPGVREKMAAVLGELTKARLTLPVGGEEAD
jgi:predicted regulator of Ras-like GTPase activity (Roadblock/LC7/MglB family)